jgi:mRNA-degrading endonuclease toxin of MazEF toxin-antitoxin module
LVAPFSTDTAIKSAGDLFIRKTDENGLIFNSRLVLTHVQPLLKEELEERLGTLSQIDLDKVKSELVWIFDLGGE